LALRISWYCLNSVEESDDHGLLTGALNVHDLFRAKVI